jgi:hypothetical protein
MKKQLFRIYLAVIVIAAMATGGCKKNTENLVNNNNSGYYIRFKANGLQQNYTIPVTTSQFHDSLTFNGNKVHIFATGGANINLHSITLGIYDNTLLTSATTYKESDLIFSYQPKVMFIYNNNPGSFGYYSISNYAPIPALFPEYAGIERDCKITMTNVTSTNIKGAFSGTVYREKNNGDADVADKIKITDGEFFLPAKF